MSGASASSLGVSGEQLKAMERLRDYKKRHERLRSLWIDIHGGGPDWRPEQNRTSPTSSYTPSESLRRSRGSSSIRHRSASPAPSPTAARDSSRGRASPTHGESPVREAPARKAPRRESPAARRPSPAPAPAPAPAAAPAAASASRTGRERPREAASKRHPRGPPPRRGRGDAPLTRAEIRELMSRDITPEDYELLLLLDEGVKKAKTLSSGAAAALPSAVGTAWVGEACMICLCALEEDEDVRRMTGCDHHFHAPCAARWLTDSKSTCPVCGHDESVMEKCIQAFMQFDHNCDGLCDVDEMKKVLVKLDASTWTEENVNILFSHVDVNKDGKIDTREFVNWLFASDAGGEQTRLRESMKIFPGG